MKKFVAIICAIAIVLSLASVVSFAEAVVDWDVAVHGNNASFDEVHIDGAPMAITDGAGKNFEDADKNKIPVTSGNTVMLRGWAQVEGKTIAEVGYIIDETATFDESFKADSADVIAAGFTNAQRYVISIPVGTLTGTHTIVGCVKLDDGTIVKLNRTYKGDTYNCKYNTTFIFEGAPAPSSDVTFHGASFDTFKVNGQMSAIHNGADGGASDKLDAVGRTIDGSDGSINEIALRGWIGFDQELEALGYQIGSNDPVFGDFMQAAEDAVKLDANGGAFATRFEIVIPTAAIEGSQTIVAVAKVNGQVVKLDDSLPTVGQATCPNTSFTYVGIPGQNPPPPQTADASMVVFMVAAAAIVVTVILAKKKEF